MFIFVWPPIHGKGRRLALGKSRFLKQRGAPFEDFLNSRAPLFLIRAGPFMSISGVSYPPLNLNTYQSSTYSTIRRSGKLKKPCFWCFFEHLGLIGRKFSRKP